MPEEDIDARISRLLDQLESSSLTFAQSQRLWAQIEELQALQSA